jgi:hypothetical protein
MLPLLLATALARAPYDIARDALDTSRRVLSGLDDPVVHRRELAREAILEAFDSHFFPAWEGTPWAFYGTSQRPGEGEIACGYFVSTTLLHAGFGVDRVRLAQQASEHIIQTFVSETEITRFRDRPLAELLAHVRAEGDGLYLVGLDYHVGYLRQDGAETRFCHSTYLGDTEVLCEPAAGSPALSSRYRVVGKLLGESMIDRWLAGEPFATVGPMRE